MKKYTVTVPITIWGLEAPDEEAARKIVMDYLKVSMKPQDLQADMVDYQKINCFPN
jgi:hypothetical protein